MKLTAELALDQVKRNKKRTLGTVMATSMATALLTAAMCFVTSGYTMLENFLGPGLGEYSGVYMMILLIPALFLGMLIICMSVTVISNIYESSAGKRLGEFGVLKCVGATRKQIRETVIYESLWISLSAIPLGLLSGTLIGFLGVLTAGHYVSYFNDLSKSIIMRPFAFSLDFHVSVITYIAAAIFSLAVVLISAGKPARKYFVRRVFPVKYELPVMSLFAGIFIVFLIMFLVTKAEIRKLRGQNIIEDIRMELI